MSEIDGGETIQAKRQRFSDMPRACEACSVRKIRCNRTIPCSNCVAYKVVCQSPSSLPNKRSNPSTNSQMEERIAAFESRLRTIETQLSHSTSAEPAGSQQGRRSSLPRDSLDSYEGESSFSRQLLAAGHIAENTLAGTNAVNTSLGNLYTLAETATVSEDHRFLRSHAVNPNKMPLPFELVTDILQRIKERTPIFCYGYFLTDISKVESLCFEAYRCSSLTLGHMTSVHGILYFLLKEFIATSDPLCRKYDLKTHVMRCEESLKSGIEFFEVLAVPGFLSVLALAFGAMKAQEDAKPYLFCTLISAAANHCRTLGYHRQKTYENKRDGDAKMANRLFWSIYISDKTLSLLLGRASFLQDFDIDTEYPVTSTDSGRRPWDENFIMAIRMAQVQGRIFDQLYSPKALKAPSEQRAQTMDDLASSIDNWRSQFTQIDASKVAYPDIWTISRPHWDVIYYSVRTCLLRVPSASETGLEISSLCFLSARLALQSHMSCLSAWEKSNALSGKDYADWVLNYFSFTPFLVVFLHVISVADSGDLQLLEKVVKSLGNIRKSSKHSEKLYKICSILAALAKQLAGTQTRFSEAYRPLQDMLQFDEHESLSPLFEPKTLQDSFGLEMADYLNEWEAYDMDSVLESWASGQSSTPDMQ
ncbi:hypothetical protein IQ07DRAFT_627077 [Pyrenochaeta sp. DS3sAY3a]|nr:hypothetical protein IQ07DRAFT_627077 [Pyrenochaeta sp. DS3sAY3a]